MKQSMYNLTLKDESGNDVLYNTCTRDFIIGNDKRLEWIVDLDELLSRQSYLEDEVEWITTLTKRQFLLEDDINELEELRDKVTELKERTDKYMIELKMTLNCNFRCTYCNQFGKDNRLTDEVLERTIKHVERVSKTYKQIHFVWLSGEPLLEFEKMYQMSIRMIEICKNNDCAYTSSVTTNGYLINLEMIALFEEMAVQHVEMTIDGYIEAHDQMRLHFAGEGTYNTVFNNLINVLETSIFATLRVKINSANIETMLLLLKAIPERLRLRTSVSFVDWSNEKQKKSLFELYKMTIEMGFNYTKNKNAFGTCESTYELLTSIIPNGRIVLCNSVYDQRESFGYLDTNGQIIIDSDYMMRQYANVLSPFDREMCRNCIELPICIGSCLRVRVNNPNYCAKKVPVGMSIVEKAKLDILSDQMRKIFITPL